MQHPAGSLQESPEREQKTLRNVEDRGGLIWKNRHREQSEQLARANADLERTRLAAEAALGRREALERDIRQLRLRIKAMLDKSATDDELISALTEERERYRAGCVAKSGTWLHLRQAHVSVAYATGWLVR